MSSPNSWLLPEGIEAFLPEQASQLETLRGKLLQLFSGWGYQLVIPPMIDFIESLLTGSGHDLDLQTFKLIDQISGKTLGLRADMTPQVARMDAHNLNTDCPTRLCYVGTVLHTRGDPLEKTRSPMQIGAELYGHNGIESDLEIICLMLEMLAYAGLQHIHLDLGHVGLFRALSKQAALDTDSEITLFEILQRKAKPELEEFLNKQSLAAELKAMLLALPTLNGSRDILEKAEKVLTDAGVEVTSALSDLAAIAEQLKKRFPHLPISFDLAELRGYHYHTGIVFAAFVPTVGREIARGGRYNNIGKIFGRARPATGFSADLKQLINLTKQNNLHESLNRIFAPYQDDPLLQEKIRDLRAAGHIVVQQLPGQIGDAKAMGCNKILIHQNQVWTSQTIE